MKIPIRLNRVHFPVTVLGPGTRVGVWVQGCTIGCAGCASRDTWDPDSGATVEVEELVSSISRLVGSQRCDGVTITGGEPFDQPEALAALISGARSELNAKSPDGAIDVLVYSGRARGHLESKHPEVLAMTDAYIPEPYSAGSGSGAPWRGSANQPLVVVSELGRQRFRDTAIEENPERLPTLQVAEDETGVWMIGLPLPGDLERLEAMMGHRGVRIRQHSWRP